MRESLSVHSLNKPSLCQRHRSFPYGCRNSHVSLMVHGSSARYDLYGLAFFSR